MLLIPIIKPRKLASFLKNLYFLDIVLNPNLLSCLSTCLMFLVYYSYIPFVKIRTLSIYTIVATLRISRRVLLTTS